jgi:putative ABC transport system permease protein
MGHLFLQDLRYARRMLRKNLGFAATAIVTLALGIGASTMIFSVVAAVLLNPLDYNEPDRIYRIHTVDEHGGPRGSIGRLHIDPLIEDARSVEAASYGYSNESSVVNREGTAFAISEYRVSEQLFDVFAERLAMGRGFRSEDDFSRTILSYQVWRDVFASDPDILESTVFVSGQELQVIGVASPGFEFPIGTGIWTKIYQGPGSENLFNLEGYARVNPGVSRAQFQAELDVFAARLDTDTAAIVAGGSAVGWEDRPLEFVVRPLLHDVVGDFRPTLLVVSGATAILLLIACLNVANLLFTRGVARTSEIAIREALGAGRWRVFRQLMTESFLLCALGGLLGFVVAAVGVRVLRAIGPEDLPRFDAIAISQDVFLFAAACVLVTVVIVGVAPGLRSSRTELNSLVNEGGRSGSAGPARSRILGTLVVAEIALAVMLVIAAGLLVRSYAEVTSADPGFNPDRMLTLVLNVPGRLDITGVDTDAAGNVTGYQGGGYLPVARFYQELARRIEALPGVAAAGATSVAPLHAGLFPVYLDPFSIVGDPATSEGAGQRLAYANQVAPEFFEALGARPVLGRLLEPSDRRDSRGVVVINEAFAGAYFGGGDPIGRRITLPNPEVWMPLGLAFQLGERVVHESEIVGVIPNIKQGNLMDPVQPAVYVPHEQWTMRRMAVLVRAEIDNPGSLIPAIRNELAEMDTTIPAVFAVYSEVVAASLARQKLGVTALAVFGLVSLTLAAVGVYGLMSYSASQRFNEIAVRSALGADREQVLKMFVGRGLRLAGIGVAAGLIGAVGLRQVIANQLYEVSALDPRVFALVPLTMLGVALLASYLPARRASRIDFSAALR